MKKDQLAVRIGENVAYLRRKHHMTQAELAEKLNVNPTFVSRVERGERMFSHQKLQMVAELFNVSYDVFYRGPEEIDPSIQNIVALLEGRSRACTASVELFLRLWPEQASK